ncbi:hypothetical protein M2165_004231 [Variovorax sp. TBS-050B]|uniref:hypothetical protein n=1 Tax=Variovorax sp. TBS-050B TaxID=2940551 RepID=UPI002474DF5F|nr:hypothetical protein [Variovorax sp. TBS-050B]MDH6594342.1 hypothetical protein [Variovorax sp. TBS-050B]
MRNNHALFHRTHVRAWLVAAALGGLSLTLGAAPINKNNIGRAGITQTGRTTTITPGAPPTNSGGSTIPISPNMGGWTQAGNYGMPPTPTGQTVGHVGFNGGFVVGGSGAVKYPVSGSYQIPWGTVAPVAAGIVCAVATAGWCGIASGVAAASPYIIDWMGRAGMTRNPATGNIERPDVDPSWPQSDGWMYYTTGLQPKTTREDSCRQYVAYQEASGNTVYRYEYSHVTTTGGSGNVGYCWYRQIRKSNGVVENTYGETLYKGTASNCPATWWVTSNGCVSGANLPKVNVPASEIPGRLGSVVPDPRVWGEVIDKGGTIEMPNPTVSGPTSIQGPETVKQNQDGTREVSRTTYNFTTNGNTVTNTTNVTTTNYYNSSNVQTGTSTTTTTPSDSTPGATTSEEPEDACTKHPEALGCQKIDFDTPDGEIPRESKDVTFQEESVLGGGSCPADAYASFGSTGQTLKVWDWQATCSYFLPIRFILMALAAFSAVLIILPGGKDA